MENWRSHLSILNEGCHLPSASTGGRIEAADVRDAISVDDDVDVSGRLPCSLCILLLLVR